MADSFEDRVRRLREKYGTVQKSASPNREFSMKEFRKSEAKLAWRFIVVYPVVVVAAIQTGSENLMAVIALASGILLLPIFWVVLVYNAITGGEPFDYDGRE